MIYRCSIADLPMIEPCFGMNGHPRARMNTILRQCEAEVKIFKSRWFPASIYRSKWSIIAGQGSNMRKISKKSDFLIFDPWPAIIDHLDLQIDVGKPAD